MHLLVLLPAPWWRLSGFCLLAMLAACAGGEPRQRVNPPQVSIQSLELQSGRRVVLSIRVQNHSDVAMQFGLMQVDLQLASRDASHIELKIENKIPAHSAEAVAYSFQPHDETARMFERALQAGISYRLDGVIHSVDPERDFDIETLSQLNPVPGKPGEFR